MMQASRCCKLWSVELRDFAGTFDRVSGVSGTSMEVLEASRPMRVAFDTDAIRYTVQFETQRNSIHSATVFRALERLGDEEFRHVMPM
jgi:hypothetical protein